MQSISGGLITTGLDGYITLVNAAALQLFDRRENDLVYQPVQQFFLDTLPSVGSERTHTEVRCITPNKFRKTFRVTVSPA